MKLKQKLTQDQKNKVKALKTTILKNMKSLKTPYQKKKDNI